MAMLALCSRVVAAEPVSAHLPDFTKGDTPNPAVISYSLHLGAMGGVPNGIQKLGRDATQICVVNASNGILQTGDVILGVNDKLFAGDVIETWRAAVAGAPERDKDGNLRVIRWRKGARETVDYFIVAPVPDLTRGGMDKVDRNGTYNLGPTGLRGWIYTKPASNLDANQGRTTASSRQILVTHVGTNSPAQGVVEVNDILLGVGGKPFDDDARKSFGRAITEAEKTENKGILNLIRWRGGTTENVQLKLKAMGLYSATAPYACPKSQLILAEACTALEKEPLTADWCGAVNGIALLSTGTTNYLPKVQAFARSMAPKEPLKGCDTWGWGYQTVFLCEYYLATGDKEVLPSINAYSIAMAKAQSLYGTFGHGGSDLTPDGKLHGSIPPYGPVNMAGLVANLGIVLAQKCGVTDPEIAPAIQRASKFFGYYVDKGAIPYGEHMPCISHENNGKSPIAALMFGIQGTRVTQAQFFAKMATAAYANRECGHTGQGFSYLWCLLGANAAGPDAAAAYMKEIQWHLDLVRRCDGSFTYDGGEQYGPGKTDDDTYYGRSGYYGLSPAATYVLAYSVPLKKLCITGKDSRQANMLSTKDVAEAIAAGRFDLDRKKMTPAELVAAMASWSPAVRSWAATELAKRPEAAAMAPQLMALAEGKDAHVRQGACETLGYLKDTNALPVLVRLLKHDDRWLRVKAANALKNMKDAARPVMTDMLKTVADTAEPLQPIVWDDPIQFTQSELAGALFDGLMRRSCDGVDRKLLYPAIKAIARNANGSARATLSDTFKSSPTPEDVQALAPDILAAIKVKAPADTMGANELWMAGSALLAKYHYKEGIRAIMDYVKIIDGHASQERVPILMDLLKTYGTAAKPLIPELKEVLAEYQKSSFPADCNKLRIDSVAETIAFLEKAKDQPDLRSVAK